MTWGCERIACCTFCLILPITLSFTLFDCGFPVAAAVERWILDCTDAAADAVMAVLALVLAAGKSLAHWHASSPVPAVLHNCAPVALLMHTHACDAPGIHTRCAMATGGATCVCAERAGLVISEVDACLIASPATVTGCVGGTFSVPNLSVIACITSARFIFPPISCTNIFDTRTLSCMVCACCAPASASLLVWCVCFFSILSQDGLPGVRGALARA